MKLQFINREITLKKKAKDSKIVNMDNIKETKEKIIKEVNVSEDELKKFMSINTYRYNGEYYNVACMCYDVIEDTYVIMIQTVV